MPLFFLVPVLTACITGYFFNKKKSGDCLYCWYLNSCYPGGEPVFSILATSVSVIGSDNFPF